MMTTPAFQIKLPCLPPHKSKQNPTYIEVNVWRTIRDARAYFKSVNEKWGRDAIAYFLEYDDPARPHLLGEVHCTMKTLSIPTISHEFSHVAESFDSRHTHTEIAHCPYKIGNSREECVAYVHGTLMYYFYTEIPPTLREHWLKNSFRPLQ